MKAKEKMVVMLLVLVMIFIVIGLAVCNDTDIKADSTEPSQIIYEYVNAVNRGTYKGIADLFVKNEAEDLRLFLSNEINKDNHMGIFNVSSIEVNGILHVDNIDDYGIDLALSDYSKYDDVNVYYVEANVVAFEKSNYYNNGINNMLFLICKEDGVYKIIQTIILSEDEKTISLLDCDTPVANTDGEWEIPTYINVYRNSTGVTEKVIFFNYCHVVTVCEAEQYAEQLEGIKAVAMAVKNYAWKRIVSPKYGSTEKGCDVYDNTNDQVYNPTKYANDDATSKNVCNNAVRSTWNYVMLDYDYKLFVGFHCDKYVSSSSGMAAYAKEHGGVLSQSGAKDLAASGYSWQEILHYYYDYGTCNTTQLADGPIRIVKLDHSVTASRFSYDMFYHWATCTTCGCEHKEEHIWETLTSSLDRCTVCGYVIQSTLVR